MDFDEPTKPGVTDQISNAHGPVGESIPIATASVVEEMPSARMVELPLGSYAGRNQRPRAWTSFLVVGVALICFLTSSLIFSLIATLFVHGSVDLKTFVDKDMVKSVMKSRVGLTIMVVLPQLGLVIPAIAAAVLSPVETRRRLSLVRGCWPIWTWVAVACATPLIGMVSAMTFSSFMPESESIKELTSVFRSHGESGFLIPLALMIGLTPAFCEELLFRGYMQTRLTKSFGPMAGIATASFLFALLHMDFVHIISVFPLGLFLGWVTWQSGTLFPAMMGHFVNNSISVVLAVQISETNPELPTMPLIGMMAAILACGAAGLAATCYASMSYRTPDSGLGG